MFRYVRDHDLGNIVQRLSKMATVHVPLRIFHDGTIRTSARSQNMSVHSLEDPQRIYGVRFSDRLDTAGPGQRWSPLV